MSTQNRNKQLWHKSSEKATKWEWFAVIMQPVVVCFQVPMHGVGGGCPGKCVGFTDLGALLVGQLKQLPLLVACEARKHRVVLQ